MAPYIVKSALQLAPLFFLRPGELRKAEWSEFDLGRAEWRIGIERMKRSQKEKDAKKGGRQADDTGPTRPTGKDGEKPLVGREAIADHLKVSVSTIKNYMKTRAFPYHKPAGTIQAYPSELDTWNNRPRKKNYFSPNCKI